MFQIVELLLVFQVLQSSDGRLDRDSGRQPLFSCRNHSARSAQLVSSSSFATEGSSVLGVQADLNFLHHFPEGGAIMGPGVTNDSDFW